MEEGFKYQWDSCVSHLPKCWDETSWKMDQDFSFVITHVNILAVKNYKFLKKRLSLL